MELPSILSFERKLEVSDGLMYSGDWSDINKPDKWKVIPITKRQNRSTQSSYGISDKKKSEPNPVASDSDDANLPMDKDTLRLNFSLRVIGDLGRPFACNCPKFQKTVVEKVNEFKNRTEDLKENLALRYAYNIANGRFLWRNRVGAEKITIKVYLEEGESGFEFNATDFSMRDFVEGKDNSNLIELQNHIWNGLKGDSNSFKFLKVEAFTKLGKGQHVFPSQEMNMEKGKELFKLNDCAAMHNVKIGNAIRTIDTWYNENPEFPIAAEPFGSVTQIGQAFRKSKNDLFSVLKDWVNGKEVSDDDKNFVVANLIRGGLFQGKSKKNSDVKL